MKAILAMLLLAAGVAVPCLAAERFTSAQPSPLKPLETTAEDGNAVRFSGSVQLSGQFLIIWERKNGKPHYTQVMFSPDARSVALLPHPVDEKPLADLEFTNVEQAVALLRELATAKRNLPEHQFGLAGSATVTIRNYRTEVVCDQRWYTAELVSVEKRKPQVVAARKVNQGC